MPFCLYQLLKNLILDLLEKQSVEGDISIQHALLGALKNLAIPHRNKEKLLQYGIINILYPLIKSNQDLVVFKLLGTFRMVIDGQSEYSNFLVK